jgi:hypothetical protein
MKPPGRRFRPTKTQWTSPRESTRSETSTAPFGTSHDGRYLHLPQIDGLRSLDFSVPPAPIRGEAEQRVRQLVEALEGATDEGSGGALDLLIEAWVASWIASVNTDFVDHASVIDVHYGQATEWLVEAEAELEFADAKLAEVEQNYTDARTRLAGSRLHDDK